MIYLQLFLSFLQLGMFSIGGGYAAIPLIRDQIVTSHTWLTMSYQKVDIENNGTVHLTIIPGKVKTVKL